MGTPEILLHIQLMEPKGKNLLTRDRKDTSVNTRLERSRAPLHTLHHRQNEFEMELEPQQRSIKNRAFWKNNSNKKSWRHFTCSARLFWKKQGSKNSMNPAVYSDASPCSALPELHSSKHQHFGCFCSSCLPVSRCTQRFSPAWF